MADYISRNPQFITDGFLRAGISQALDQIEDEADDVNFDQLEYEDENLDDDEYDNPEDSDEELEIL